MNLRFTDRPRLSSANSSGRPPTCKRRWADISGYARSDPRLSPSNYPPGVQSFPQWRLGPCQLPYRLVDVLFRLPYPAVVHALRIPSPSFLQPQVVGHQVHALAESQTRRVAHRIKSIPREIRCDLKQGSVLGRRDITPILSVLLANPLLSQARKRVLRKSRGQVDKLRGS